MTLVEERIGREAARALALPPGLGRSAAAGVSPDSCGSALVVLPTYRAAMNLARLLGHLRGLPGDVHVLVVDDNSPDGTGCLADELAGGDKGIGVVHRLHKLGLGTAYVSGFQFGLKHGYQYICTMDADFSHPPESLPQ